MADDWIQIYKYMDVIDELEQGETVRVNHDDCPAGQDNKRRLYLTKPAHTDVVLGYCHNCNGKGVRTAPGSFRKDIHTRAASFVLPAGGKFRIPPKLEIGPGTWPNDAHTWRIQKGLSNEDCTQHCIAHDPNTNQMYLPIYSSVTLRVDGQTDKKELIGYQMRRLRGDGPKYTTVLKDKSIIPSTYLDSGPFATRVVLVEDLASGIVVAKQCHRDEAVMVNYGVKNTPQVLDRCSASLKMGLVWLDNDNDHVRAQARAIARTWGLISGKDIDVQTQYKDPKKEQPYTIRKILDGMNRNVNT